MGNLVTACRRRNDERGIDPVDRYRAALVVSSPHETVPAGRDGTVSVAKQFSPEAPGPKFLDDESRLKDRYR